MGHRGVVNVLESPALLCGVVGDAAASMTAPAREAACGGAADLKSEVCLDVGSASQA